MTATGDYGALGAQSMQTLAGFFLQCQGKANPFVYVDPTDNTVARRDGGDRRRRHHHLHPLAADGRLLSSRSAC